MNITVTGGKGFIGTYLSSALKQLGHAVCIIDRPDDVDQMADQQFRNPKIIFHLAATARVGVSLERPDFVLRNNFNGIHRVLEYCRNNPDTMLIFVSSSSVRFADLTKNPYALSKKIGEDMLNMYVETYGIKAVTVRLFNVFGAGEADMGPHTTVVKRFKKAYDAGEGLIINGDGSMARDFTHVEDAVRGLIGVASDMQRNINYELYELGSGSPTTILDIAHAFVEGTELPITFGPERAGDALRTIADSDLVPFGWEPKIHVLDHIREWKLSRQT